MYLPIISLSALLYAFPAISSPLTPISHPLTPSTANHLFADEGPYHPRCRTATRAPPHALPGLSPTTCEDLIPVVCGMATAGPSREVYRNRWVWAFLPGCALGYFLPEAAELPDDVECQFYAFKPLVEKCAFDSNFNAGGINVGELPSLEGSGTATRDEDGIRYMMASTPLTKIEDSILGQVLNHTTA